MLVEEVALVDIGILMEDEVVIITKQPHKIKSSKIKLKHLEQNRILMEAGLQQTDIPLMDSI